VFAQVLLVLWFSYKMITEILQQISASVTSQLHRITQRTRAGEAVKAAEACVGRGSCLSASLKWEQVVELKRKYVSAHHFES
jgi:hypothetical protein